MRTAPLVRLVPSPLIGATYDGLRQEIILSSRAAEVLNQSELSAMVEHENGHRQLWHIERSLACGVAALVTGVLGTYYGDWQIGLMGLGLGVLVHRISAIMAEFEADQRAIRLCGPVALLGVFTKQLRYHPEIERGWVFRMRRYVAQRKL